MKSTFRILFYAKWEASDEAKMLPIYVRITINGTKASFSLNGGDSVVEEAVEATAPPALLSPPPRLKLVPLNATDNK